MQDLFARNGSGFLGTALCAQITSRRICGGLAPCCQRSRENVMRFPPGTDGQLEAHPLYPMVFRASVWYQTHVRSRLLSHVCV